MELIIAPTGRIHCLYAEAIDLHALGVATIARASYVEPDGQGRWWVYLWPVQGPVLGPFTLRSEALQAEQAWLQAHWHGDCAP